MLNTIKKNLDARITFSIVGIIVAMYIVMGFFVYQFTYNKVTDQLTEATLLQTKAISAEIEDLFENGSIVTEQLSYHKDIKTYLKEVVHRDQIKTHPLYKEVRQALVEIKENSSYYSTIWIANDSANFYFDDIGNFADENYDAGKRPWYETAVTTHNVTFTKPYKEWSTGETVLSSIKALRESGDIYGFVAVDIVLESIPDMFTSHYLGYEESHFLISDDGQYVYHPRLEKMMKSSISNPSDPLYKYRSIIFQGAGNFELVEIDDREMLLISYPVVLANWRVVTLIDKQILFSQIQGLFMILFVMMTLTLLFSIVVIRNVVKTQTNPFGILVQYGEDITHGELNKNIPEEYLQREDEMGRLSQSFQLIIDTFRNENVYLEEKIQEKNLELKQQYDYILETEKVASLGSLVAGVAHEINTPLGNSVTSLSYLHKVNEDTKKRLLDGSLSREGLVNYIEEIEKSIRLIDGNLLRTVGLVDHFKKIAVSKDDESIEQVNLHGIISMVEVSLKHEIKKGKHSIKNNIPDGLILNSYSGALIQLFTNLMMNSFVHGFKDMEHGTIDIESFTKEETLTIIYKDNGIGMTKEAVKNIYEPFFTTMRNEGHVGLGMAIVFNIVNQKLKGTINVTSSEGRGTTILIQIPSNL